MPAKKEISKEKLEKLFDFLTEKAQEFPEPMSEQVAEKYDNNPFLILISCLLSLRARDSVVINVVTDLFKEAQTPQEIVDMPREDLEKLIKSSGFYHQKAKTLQHVSQVLLDEYDGEVPDDYDTLTDIKGIGAKTANLVLSEAFDKPAIAVDTHVHRIANHLGLVDTEDVDETQEQLEEIIPKTYWKDINHLFVAWGQNGCTPQQSECTCPTEIIEDC